MAMANNTNSNIGLEQENHNHNRIYNKIHTDSVNNTIEEILNINDNFGHKISIYRQEYDSIDKLKNVICSKMELLHSVLYRPNNLRLFRLDNHEIVEYMDAEGIFNIKIVVVPIVCNNVEHI